jgi:hypothetical protein
VIAGIAAIAVVWKLSDSSLVKETDASKKDAARVASQLMITNSTMLLRQLLKQ